MLQNPHHFLHVGLHLTCDTWLPCRYTRQNLPSTPSPPLTREKLAQHRAFLSQPGTKLAQHALKRRFSAIFRALGEFCHAQAGNKPSRANFFTHRTQPRGNCETAITTATADADQHETTITTATEKLTQNTHFSPAKAMAVSVGAKPARAKATPVSRERFVMPAGYGGAWPGFETTRRATHQRPGAAGVEGAGGSGGHGRASRSTTPSEARVWRSRGRPGPTAPGTPAEPQATSSIANYGCTAGVKGARGPGCGARGRRQGLDGLRDDAPSHTPATHHRRHGGRRRDRRARLRRPWAAGPGRGAGGRQQGQGGPRDRPLRAAGSRVAISRAGRRPPAHTAARPTSSARTLRGIATARHSKRGRHQPTPCASALTHP